MSTDLQIAMLSVHTCPLAMLGGKETGGMNVYVRDLSRELGGRGHHVDVYTRSQNPDVPRISQEIGTGARVIHLPAGPERPYDKHRVYDHLPEFIDGVLAQAEADGVQYDILHSHYWLSGAAAWELHEHWGTPIVHTFHTLGKMKNVVAQKRPREQETSRRISVELDIVDFAHALIASTPAEEEQLTQLYGTDPSRIHVISPGVDTDRFHPTPAAHAKERIGIRRDCRIILFVGRIEPLKGIDHLLRAIARVVDRLPELRGGLCVPIIGGEPHRIDEDEEMVRLQELRRRLGIGDVVTFLGSKNQDTLQYYYSAAEMVVMPSDYESFGMVALEAMACGTPVIASDVGGLAFLVKDGQTGYRVPAGDTEALADTIAHLLTDELSRRRIGQRAACWAESYAWENVAEQIESVYAQIMAGVMAGDGPSRTRTWRGDS
ncbi:MAG: glycosyltransferase [Chloroflexota bacterium]|nr:glycosyltransferase [Chloroflexota bacterium]